MRGRSPKGQRQGVQRNPAQKLDLLTLYHLRSLSSVTGEAGRSSLNDDLSAVPVLLLVLLRVGLCSSKRTDFFLCFKPGASEQSLFRFAVILFWSSRQCKCSSESFLLCVSMSCGGGAVGSGKADTPMSRVSPKVRIASPSYHAAVLLHVILFRKM